MRRSSRIVAPYHRLEYRPWFPWLRAGLMVLMAATVIFATLLTSMAGTRLLKVAVLPIGAILLTVMWMLPDADRHRAETKVPAGFVPVLLTFLAGMVVWPSYIAIVLPGLPWLTPPRMILAVMLALMLVHYSQHRNSRGTLIEVLGYDRVALTLFGMYEALNFMVLPLAPGIGDTISYLFLQQVMALSTVLMAAVMMTNPDLMGRIYRTILLGMIFTMLVGLLENYMQSPPWANYIPSFMQIDEAFLTSFLSPQSRIGDNRYRIRTTFPVVLYYTQYLCLVLPMLLHAIWRTKGRQVLAGVALVPLILHTVWYCNARTAVLALLIPLFSFGALALVKQLRDNRQRDMLKPGVAMAVVLLLVGMLGGLLATSHRAQMYTFGGSQHNASDETRDQQWANAWRQLRKNPIGIGAGNSVNAVGVPKPGKDNLIVDSLYINVLVDVGYLGFACFFGLFVWVGIRGFQVFLRAGTVLEEQAGAAAIGLISYVIACYVISNTDVNYLAFLFSGMVIATKRLQDQRLAAEAAAVRVPSTDLAPRRA
ncbi:MAG: O-antigen ligase family protein [Alphaproteobacteria bacterium]|nr:O-antigen ligase family protein [Alphaproteobacteria bacterium]